VLFRSLLDEEDKKEYIEFVDSGTIKKTTSECKEKLVDLVQKRADTRGEFGASITSVSKRTGKRIEQEMGISTGYAEKMTQARIDAVADLRNFVTYAAMLYLMAHISPHQLHLNLDATQFTVGYDSDQNIQVKYMKSEEGAPLKTAPLQNKNEGITSYFIKYYMLMSASGNVADPVYVVADDNMEENVIDVHEVPGLSLGVGFSKAYIVFCKTRGCNRQFYE